MGGWGSRSTSSDRGRPSSSLHDDGHPADEMPAPRLNVLKTKAESRALAETIKVWTLELPIKAANDILILCKDQIGDGDTVDLQHLRRFAKPTQLPLHLQPPGTRASSTDSRYSTASNSSNGSKSSSRSRSRMRKRKNSLATTTHLLICPVDVISYEDLSSFMMRQSCFGEDGFPLRIKEVVVPLLAPTSVEQAQQFTAQYWPTTYRKTNPFGPHPSLVAKAEEEIREEAGKYMMLARQVAMQSASSQCGINAGCVIVERKADRHGEIVAIAGDTRSSGTNGTADGASQCSGNVACHAAMRGIGMVARKRVRVAAPKPQRGNSEITPEELLIQPVQHVKNTPESVSKSLLDYPLNDLERGAFDEDNLIANGYLCVDLEIYMTHEPCLMCSMAIDHSRFSRCVFGQRMPASGGMAGDSGLGYGLFWRSELNWKLLCWEYTALKGQGMAALEDGTQV